jgi:hypothetical protein
MVWLWLRLRLWGLVGIRIMDAGFLIPQTRLVQCENNKM